MIFSLKVDDELELFLLQEHHAEPLFALVDANRARLRSWLPWVDRTQGPADIRHFIRESTQRMAEGLTLAVGIACRGSIAGGTGLKIDPLNQRCEIGYWLAEPYEGQGLITRAVRTLAQYAFERLNLHRVEVRCATQNARSRAVPERLGFTYEGTLRETFLCGNEYQDIRVYSLLASERERLA